MNKKILHVMFSVMVICIFTNAVHAGGKILKMSTTTSTQASGLLDILLPALERDTGIRVKVMAKGTGAAIRDGKDGNVDVIFVHAKAREEKFIEEGYGTKRYAIMHNDFIIIGHKNDPAGIKDSVNAPQALAKIARSGAFFVSRGDDSGTHTKEKALWEKSGIKLTNKTITIVKNGKKININSLQPDGQWYISLGQGMGKTITYANEKQVYTLADRGTYIKYRYGSEQEIDLVVLCEGDPWLNNPYGVIPINPKKYPHVKYELAEQFAKWLVSSKGQSIIANYKLFGKQLFYPDAVK